jgi:hypothetical protein
MEGWILDNKVVVAERIIWISLQWQISGPAVDPKPPEQVRFGLNALLSPSDLFKISSYDGITGSGLHLFLSQLRYLQNED